MKNIIRDEDKGLSSLIVDIADIAGINTVLATNNQAVEVKKKSFEFEQEEERPGFFFIKCSVCSVSGSKKEKKALLQAALEFNYDFYNGWSPVLAFDEAKNEIFSITGFSLSQVEASQLYKKMQQYVEELDDTINRLQQKAQSLIKTEQKNSAVKHLLQARLLGEM